MIITRPKVSKAFTLIEVMLAIAIMVIALMGTSLAYIHVGQFIVNEQYSQAAVQLATQKIEVLRAAGYNNIANSIPQDAPIVAGYPYLRQTQVSQAAPTAQVPNPYKQITVTVFWPPGTKAHRVALDTYIGLW